MSTKSTGPDKSYRYDQAFLDHTLKVSLASARLIEPLVKAVCPVQSVLDVGCSRGAWLLGWRDLGVSDYMGLDGDYVDPRSLVIEASRFRACNLAQPFTLGRSFDLVQCLEVAEHLPLSRAPGLVADLTSHANWVLFSAAPPGQGGENHINEQPYEFWRDLFAAQGFLMLDCLRRQLTSPVIAPWYRYNLFLFVRKEQEVFLSATVRKTWIAPNQAVPDVSPWSYKLRKRLVSCLPGSITRRIAQLGARFR